jgi:hypothetical protein
LLCELWRPRRVAHPFALVLRDEFEQRLEGVRHLVDAGGGVASFLVPRRHRRDRERGRVDLGD